MAGNRGAPDDTGTVGEALEDRGFSRDTAERLYRFHESAAAEQHTQPFRKTGLPESPQRERRTRSAVRRRRVDAAAADGRRDVRDMGYSRPGQTPQHAHKN